MRLPFHCCRSLGHLWRRGAPSTCLSSYIPGLVGHSTCAAWDDDRSVSEKDTACSKLAHRCAVALICIKVAARLDQGRCPSWVKTGKAQCEQMFSALPPRADIAQRSRHVRFVPISDMGRRVHLGRAYRMSSKEFGHGPQRTIAAASLGSLTSLHPLEVARHRRQPVSGLALGCFGAEVKSVLPSAFTNEGKGWPLASPEAQACRLQGECRWRMKAMLHRVCRR